MIYSDKEITPLNLTFNDVSIPVYTFDAVIVGSGAAGLSAAGALLSMGQKNIAVITESVRAGTSKNSGAGNQAYLISNKYNGGSMDGDIALVQESLSERCFYRLADLGVDFPKDIYGKFAETDGKTDAGFYTAKKITEAANKYIVNGNVPVFNRFRIISIIKSEPEDGEETAAGLLAIDKDMQKTYADKMQDYNLQTRINNANKNIFGKIQDKLKPDKLDKNAKAVISYDPKEPSGNEYGYVLFRAANIIYAVGGPAGIYEDNTHLYPYNMTCSLGAAFMAGVKGKNLTETVFCPAYISSSNEFKWKIEGDLLKVNPRFYSANQDGGDEAEFPVNSFETADGLRLAMLETDKNRKIFIDYRTSSETVPEPTEDIYDKPCGRLISRNWDLYKLFLDNGIDLTKEPIEISLCAYHLNGGLDCDIWSESNIKHFFPVGEAAAVFGTELPDGASLAATQTTSFRAAEKIAKDYKDYNKNITDMQDFWKISSDEVYKYITVARHLLKNAVKNIVSENVTDMRKKYQKRFSECCMFTRSSGDIMLAIADCRFDIANFTNDNKIDDISYLSDVFENHDILITQYVFLQAVKNYIMAGGKSRGSYIILDENNDNPDFDNSVDFNNLVSFVKIKSAHTFEIDFSTRNVNSIPE